MLPKYSDQKSILTLDIYTILGSPIPGALPQLAYNFNTCLNSLICYQRCIEDFEARDSTPLMVSQIHLIVEIFSNLFTFSAYKL